MKVINGGAEIMVLVMIRKGLSAEHLPKTIPVYFDGLDAETTDDELRTMAINQVESELRKSEDYPLYGKNWYIKDVYQI